MVLLRSIVTVGGFTMLSRTLGFVRDILVAAFLGAGPIADAFFVAFKMPNFFRRLFAEGAFNAAFVPLFATKLTDDGKSSAAQFATAVLSVMVVFLLVFVTGLQIAMPWLMYVFAPGFVDDPEKFSLAIELTRITFPYLLFISLVSLLGGVLNSLGRFAAAAATPVILNIVLIGAMLLATPHLPSAGHSLAWGVAVAGVAQFLWLVYACPTGRHLVTASATETIPAGKAFAALDAARGDWCRCRANKFTGGYRHRIAFAHRRNFVSLLCRPSQSAAAWYRRGCHRDGAVAALVAPASIGSG